MSIRRWYPYRRDAMSLREAMDRLLEESMVPGEREEGGPIGPLRIDMFETDEGIVVKSDLPGLDPEDVEISISENVLTIKGEFEEEQETDRENVHIKERRVGAFQRSVALPRTVDAENAEAEFENGVLRVILPCVEEEKPKQIPVRGK